MELVEPGAFGEPLVQVGVVQELPEEQQQGGLPEK